MKYEISQCREEIVDIFWFSIWFKYSLWMESRVLRAGGCVCCIHWASDSAWFNSRSQHWHFKSEDFMRPCPLLFVYSAGQCVDRGSVRGQQRSGNTPAVWRSHWPMLMMGERFIMNSWGTSGTDHQHVLAQPLSESLSIWRTVTLISVDKFMASSFVLLCMVHGLS